MPHKKSFIARIAEIILRRTKPKYMDSEDEADDFLAAQSRKPQKIPGGILKPSPLTKQKSSLSGMKIQAMQFYSCMVGPM